MRSPEEKTSKDKMTHDDEAVFGRDTGNRIYSLSYPQTRLSTLDSLYRLLVQENCIIVVTVKMEEELCCGQAS